VEGNAGGEITACDRPAYLALTWEFGGAVSWVEVRLAAEGRDRARLTLTHLAHVDEHWDTYGPGAAGVGWELGLVGLSLYLDQPEAPKIDEAEFAGSAEGKGFMAASSDAWGQAAIASGDDRAAALAASRRTAAFYLGEAPPGG
jgi:hypothetical protein